MTHLSTEELLLHCDGELVAPRAEHLGGCASCQTAMVDAQGLLLEVQHELRLSVPAETAESRAASWSVLEKTLYPPQRVLSFPLRWSPTYGLAAGLLIAAFAGYLALRQPSAAPPAEVADATPFEARPADPPGPVNPARPVTPVEIAPEVKPPAASVVVESPAAVGQQQAARALSAPERFTMPEFAAAPPPAEQITFSTFELASAIELPIGPLPIVVDPPLAPLAVAVPTPKASAETPASLLASIDGRWMLMKAGVWEQDVEPELRGGRLFFVGSVEHAASEQQFTAAVSKVAGSRSVGFDVRLRREGATAQEQAIPIRRTAPRAVTGVVRNSLLAHFSDAARRSFQTPTPTALESEFDRYVTDVFRGQSRLLAHVYSLNRLLASAGANDVEHLGPAAVERFRDVMSFHLAAAFEQQARIYDRLSEALPRRFWAYRETEPNPADKTAWAGESGELLQQTLLLDGMLTELLSAPRLTIDASSASPSPGQLLHRIRSGISRLRNHPQALQ